METINPNWNFDVRNVDEGATQEVNKNINLMQQKDVWYCKDLSPLSRLSCYQKNRI